MYTPITKIIETKEGRHVKVALFQKDGQPMCWVDKQGNIYHKKNLKIRPTYILNSRYVIFHYNANTHILVHRAVLTAWRGPCPPGYECDHINNIKTDNRLCNLRWLPRKQNHARRRKYIYHDYNIAIFDRANLTLLLKTNSVKVAVAFLSGDPNINPRNQTHGTAFIHLPECTDHLINTRIYQIVVTKKKRERR